MNRTVADSFIREGYVVRKAIFECSELESLVQKFHLILNS